MQISCWTPLGLLLKALSCCLTKGSIKMNKGDRHLLGEILAMKLSAAGIQKLYLNTSTQKCESVNRAISASLPKNVTHSRNAFARASSAVHRVNHGVSNSLHMKLRNVGASLPQGSKAALAVKQIGTEQKYNVIYRKMPHVKARKSVSKLREAQEFFNYERENKSVRSDHGKGQLYHVIHKRRGK